MSFLIRKYINCIIEAATSTTQAASQGLALYQTQDGGHNVHILYNPKNINTEQNPVVGVMRTDQPNGTCNDASMIIISAAEQGLGPLLYDIAMSTTPHGLTADRDQVSNQAQNVWKYYNKNRSDVQKNLLMIKTILKHRILLMIADYMIERTQEQIRWIFLMMLNPLTPHH